jgi:uncharacterized protein
VNELVEALFARRPQRAVPVLDAHAHGGPYSLFHIPDHGPAAMVRVMDRCGVSRALLSSHLAIQLDATAGNAETAAAVEAFPDRFGGYLVVNPWQDPVAELSRWADDPRFVGIKLHPSLHAYPLTGSRYAPVWEYASRTGCPVLTHTAYGSDYDNLWTLGRVADRYPRVSVLAGHAGITWVGFDDAIAVARAAPNLVLEVCGSFISGDDIARMVDELGPDKVVYGSDFPFIDMRVSLGRVLFAPIGEAARADVLGGTMARLLAVAGR